MTYTKLLILPMNIQVINNVFFEFFNIPTRYMYYFYNKGEKSVCFSCMKNKRTKKKEKRTRNKCMKVLTGVVSKT